MSVTIVKISDKKGLVMKDKAISQIRTALALGKKGIVSF